MKERGDTLQGELVVKNMRLTDMQVKCKLLCVHRDILQEQRDKLSESKRQLVEELVSNIQCKELEIPVFCMLMFLFVFPLKQGNEVENLESQRLAIVA